uniref:TNFRSF3 n=1 Tax=Lepidosiren paradoxus TaxID=7883 RepID=A0A6G6CWA0_LEPPA|nr:TNFRSF3 [Lepidosiren paradoxa]
MADAVKSHRCVVCLLHLIAIAVFSRPSMENLPYAAENGQCRNSLTEYYMSEIDICCQRCSPGQFAKVKCNAKKNTVCQECDHGTFTALYNYSPNCHICQTCDKEYGLLEKTPCLKEKDTECICKEGTYCETLSTNKCQHCEDYTPCSPGEEVEVPGTKTSDTKCKPCEDKFYNNKSSLTAKCLPHTRCQMYAQAGTKTHDAVCSSSVSSFTTLEVTTVESTLTATLPTPGNGMAENIKDNTNDDVQNVAYRPLMTPTDTTSNHSEHTPLFSNGHVKEESQPVGSPVSDCSSIPVPNQQVGSPSSFVANGGIVKIGGDVIIINRVGEIQSWKSPGKNPLYPVAVRPHCDDNSNDNDNLSHSEPQEDLQTPIQEEQRDPTEDTYVCIPQQECGKEHHLAVQEMSSHT